MNGDTKLSEALNYGPEMLEYIISLNPHDFERLRNPLMRKVMPVRISLKRIAAMVEMPLQDFLDRVNDIAGLERETAQTHGMLSKSSKETPEWMRGVDETKIRWVDVLEGDEKLLDPMPPINIAVNSMQPGEVIGVKHKWEPQPLFDIWDTRGLLYWTRQIGKDEWHIFIKHP